jgi:hypothetical protein
MNLQGKYKHYKGNLYEVIDVGKHSDTLEELVIYRALYGNKSLWVRPIKNFFSEVEINGIKQKRFVKID